MPVSHYGTDRHRQAAGVRAPRDDAIRAAAGPARAHRSAVHQGEHAMRNRIAAAMLAVLSAAVFAMPAQAQDKQLTDVTLTLDFVALGRLQMGEHPHARPLARQPRRTRLADPGSDAGEGRGGGGRRASIARASRSMHGRSRVG